MDTIDDLVTVKYLNELWNTTNNINNIGILSYIKQYVINYISNYYYRLCNKFYVANIKKNLHELRKLGFIFYNNLKTNNECPIDENSETLIKDIELVVQYKNGTPLTRKLLLQKICYCIVFKKYKSGDKLVPSNYRYFIRHHNTILILDRMWYNEVITLCASSLPNPNIFKVRFIKDINDNTLYNTASNNTLSLKNVILIDLHRAYDSIEWDVLEELLYNNLIRKIGNQSYGYELVQQYMIILQNRIITYNKHIINVFKGIPLGLPSSILIFTLIIEEIINLWLNDNINNFTIDIDFILNIYVDDFYIKIINYNKKDIIVTSLITYLTKYKLIINFNKSKVDTTLYSNNSLINKFKALTPLDFYLGIPFTRDIKLYMMLILNDLYERHTIKYTWGEIYSILLNANDPENKLLTGYMNYKLKPIIGENTIISFLQKYKT